MRRLFLLAIVFLFALKSSAAGKQPDMADLSDRDLAISIWYVDMGQTIENLQKNTGHKFTPANKTESDPIKILEEQLAFMRRFLEESKRIEKSQSAPVILKKAEQGAAANP